MAGSAPTNSAAVDFEKQQAAEADAKEAARQQQLQQGQAAIDAIFNGTPEMANTTSNYDWSTFTPSNGRMPASGMPAGYTAVQIPGASAGATTDASGRSSLLKGTPNTANALTMNTNNTLSGYNTGGGAGGADGTTAPTWGLEDASGKIYKPGDALSITSQTPTGKTTGGFGDDFYQAYGQKVLDYYQPDEQRQYDSAKRDLTYNLARAGTLQSSTAGDKQGELAYNDALQKANIVANANSQVGNLKSQIQGNKESLINQLYATNDPTLTANLAESSAKASQLQDPNLTPAAALFSPIAVGATSALSGLGGVPQYQSPYTQQQSPAPASALDKGSGKLIPG